jgi:hypothetical protein
MSVIVSSSSACHDTKSSLTDPQQLDHAPAIALKAMNMAHPKP